MIRCSNCSFENPDGAKFCQNCGQALAEAVQPAAPQPPESERRIVTVLFCDVVGSTALGDQLDPEEWTEIMNGVFERLIAAVTRYDGTVARLMGDAILCLFGAPIAHEDDPYRAILASLDMLHDLQPYQEQIRRRLAHSGIDAAPTDFEIRIGINTGLVVVGRVGSGQGHEYTAMGDAVNLAARMEQTAGPGTIQIAHDTFKLVAPLVDAETLGPITIKGKREPVSAYRILGLKGKPGAKRGIEGMESELIGREREMNQLREALEQLRAGRGQIVCLIGEAGYGKSRLVNELAKNSQRETINNQRSKGSVQRSTVNGLEGVDGLLWLQTESLSFESTQPYGLLQRMLRRMSGISREDSPQTIRAKLGQWVASFPLEGSERSLQVIETIFGLGSSDGGQPEGEELKRKLTEGISALTREQARRRPTILVFEDLHWADPASAEMVRQLLPLTATVPLLIVSVLRPDFNSPAWNVRQAAARDFSQHYVEIMLRPLSAHESNNLIGNLLNIRELPETIGKLILEKSEGIPFFVEEIVRDLVERGDLTPVENGGGWRLASSAGQIHIPDTIEAVLVARMDRLEQSIRHTLQLASVIGRTFYYRVLKLIADGRHELDQELQTLEQKGMIRKAVSAPEPEYIFHHVLTQEAAYNMILLKNRRTYHRRAGEVMEQIFADQLDEMAPLLAHHFDQAGDSDRALRYYTQSAESAARLYANDEAVVHYSRALEAAGRLQVDPAVLANLHRGSGLAHETLGKFDQALADYDAALQFARTAGDGQLEMRVLLDLGKLWASRDYNKTGDYFQQALKLARTLDDPLLLARSLNRVGNWYANAEEPVQANRYHQEALAIFEGIDDLAGLADTLDLLGITNVLAANNMQAVAYYDRAIEIFRVLDDRKRLISSLTMRAIDGPTLQYYHVVQPTAQQIGLPLFEEGLRHARNIGWRAGESFALAMLMLRLFANGQYGKALEASDKGNRIATEIRHHQWQTGHLIYKAIMLNHLFLEAEAIQLCQEGLEIAREIGSQYWLNTGHAVLAEALFIRGDIDGMQATLAGVTQEQMHMDTAAKRSCWAMRAELALAQGQPEQALQICGPLTESIPGMSPGNVISPLWDLRARAMAALGHWNEAAYLWHEALMWSADVGERYLLWRIHAGLARSYRELGRPEETASHNSKARSEIDSLAASIPDASIKENFRRRAIQTLKA